MYSIRNTYTSSKTLSLALPIPDEYTAEGVRIARFESIVRIGEALIGGTRCIRFMIFMYHHTKTTAPIVMTTSLTSIGTSIHGPASAS
jgi:hypothetical protein